LAGVGRCRTAPADIHAASGSPSPAKALSPLFDEDLATVLGDANAAVRGRLAGHAAAPPCPDAFLPQELVSAWLEKASRLERAVVQQLMQDVSAKLREARLGDRPASRVAARPNTVAGEHAPASMGW
jgi:hypothetical protein